MRFKRWHFFFSFLFGFFTYKVFSSDRFEKVDLNALTPAKIEEMGTNFGYLDFSVTKGKLPTAIFKGKDPRYSQLIGLDLVGSGIEQAISLEGVNFSDATNVPQGISKGRDHTDSRFRGQDLTHICINEATSLQNANFDGSFNAPHGMAKGQNLIVATLGNMDLNWIKLDQASDYAGIRIAPGVKLSKPILLREDWLESWRFNHNTIEYKGQLLDHETFLKRVRFWNKLAKEEVPVALLALAEEKLLSTGQSIEAIMDQTAPYGGVDLFTASDLENFIQKELPPPCSSNYPIISSFSIANNWDETILKSTFGIEKKEFYLDLIRGCNQCGVVSDIKTQQQQNTFSRRNYNGTDLTIPLEASLKDKLTIYLNHIKGSTDPVKIIYTGLGQKGDDLGGLRKQFFDEISGYIRDEVLSGKNNRYNTPAYLQLIGQAIWRMRFYEVGIPGISLAQDLNFYQELLRPEEKAESAEGVQGLRLGQFVAHGLCSDKAEEIYKSITILNQLKMNYIEEDIDDYKNPCKQGQEGEHENLFNFLSSLVQGFQYQQKCFGAQCKVNLAQLNAAQLKLLIEGESVISPEDFLNALASSLMSEKEGERLYPEYRAAIEEIVGEEMSKGEGVEQQFLRNFLWYVTGTTSFQKGTNLYLYVYEDDTDNNWRIPYALTCKNRLDCPIPTKIKDSNKRKEHIKTTIRKTIREARNLGGFDGT